MSQIIPILLNITQYYSILYAKVILDITPEVILDIPEVILEIIQYYSILLNITDITQY